MNGLQNSSTRTIGLAGWSGSGKTTLVTKALPRLIARGFRVSTIKHAHHGFDLDQPGKDSFMHRTAGATEVMISSAKRFAILHELRDDPEWDLPDLLAKLSPVDLVLVEGFKRDPFPKLEIHRVANGKPLLQPDDPHIVAIACDTALPEAKVPVIDLNDIEGIVDMLLKHACRCRALRPPCGAGDGAAHRRLLRILRPAPADRRHGADDRRARAAGDRNRKRAARRGARPRAGSGRDRADRSAAFDNSASMAMRCATAISRPNPKPDWRSADA